MDFKIGNLTSRNFIMKLIELVGVVEKMRNQEKMLFRCSASLCFSCFDWVALGT